MPLAPTPDDVTAAAELLRRAEDPRDGLCRAAARLLRADTAALWERHGHSLELTTAGADGATPGVRVPVGPGSPAGRAAADGTRFFARDTGRDTDAAPAADQGLRSVLAEPVAARGAGAKVIVVGWRRPVSAVDPVAVSVVSLIAVQASIAIARADVAARLEHQALTDPLTDLLNRRGLARVLGRELARAGRRTSPLALAMMDIDNFKAYNDRHGHPAGDELLVAAAAAWGTRVRAQDTLARFGGEEFVLLLPECGGVVQALEIADRVRVATPGGLTASVGLALWDGREPAGQLTARADRALYVAKSSGRDRALTA